MKEETIKQRSKRALSVALVLALFVSFGVGAMPIAATDTQLQAVEPVSDRLIPLGKTTGIKLFSEGTMVVGFAAVDEVSGLSPAEQAGMQIGDVIVALNNQEIGSNEDLVQALTALPDENAVFSVKRDQGEALITVRAQYDPTLGSYRIGAWIRDSIAGIGTITYVDPKNGAFGALGHGICDADTAELMPFEEGTIMESSVVDVKRGVVGTPGELNGSFNLQQDQGVLYSNTDEGIFGQITNEQLYAANEEVEVAEWDEIEEGPATILCNVAGTTRESFDIEIVEIYQDDSHSPKDMVVEVTDEELIAITGGIVQGMSGSPILQNGKLIGAVTHVFVNDPTSGYAIFIENMLESAQRIN